MPSRKRLLTICLWFGPAWLCGCAADPPARPPASAVVQVEPWSDDGISGRTLITPHYLIHTTFDNPDFDRLISATMEGALAQYQRLAPDVPVSPRSMDCYLFATRQQWIRFTTQHTGADAAIYLQISRGGYTVRDWYAAYYIGNYATLSVAAHEGFHQFAARHFKTRIPPFLEEGLACLFEPVEWRANQPHWNLGSNSHRLSSLRTAEAAGRLRPLGELLDRHAGQVVNSPPLQVSAFYAQSWAVGSFLWEGQQGVYRRPLQTLLADAAAGRLAVSPRSTPTDSFWSKSSATELMEHYFQTPLPALDGQFRAYVRELTDAAPAATTNRLTYD